MPGHCPECPLHRKGIGDVSTILFIAHDEPLRDENLTLRVTGQPGPLFVVPYRAYHDVFSSGTRSSFPLRTASLSQKSCSLTSFLLNILCC